MTKSTKAKLEYQKKYNAQPEQKALGVARRRTRRHLIADGKVAIGDGKDVARFPIEEGDALHWLSSSYRDIRRAIDERDGVRR